MAENETGAEKTEDPTAKRLLDARNEGNITNSQDLNAAVSLLAGMALLMLLGPSIMEHLVNWTVETWNEMAFAQPDVAWFLAKFPEWLTFLIFLVAPFMGILMVLTVLLKLWQVGFLWTTKPFTPNFTKLLDIVSGMLKMFQRDSLVRLAMAMGKVIVVTWVAWAVIAADLGALASVGAFSVDTITTTISSLGLDLGFKMALAMLILSLLDFRYQQFSHKDKLKMTKEEVKEETKQMDGDPKMRQRRRQVQMTLARERMMKSVEKADVIVANPVELAVALRYDPSESAPKVVAKGARLMAQRIKEIARQSGVPIVEHKPLARALFEAVEVNEFIPENLYSGVAEILGYVWEANQRRRSA